MGMLKERLFGQWKSDKSNVSGHVLTPSSDLSSTSLPRPQQLYQQHQRVEIAERPINPDSSSIRPQTSTQHPFEWQRTNSTRVPEVSVSNVQIKQSWEGSTQTSSTIGQNQQSIYRKPAPQRDFTTALASNNTPHLASEKELLQGQDLQFRREEGGFLRQQQYKQQHPHQQGAMAANNRGPPQNPQAPAQPIAQPAAPHTIFNLSFNRKPLLESMSSFSTQQQIFVFVFMLTLSSLLFFAVLASLLYFLRQSTIYIFAVFALGGGGYGFLNWSRMKAQQEVAQAQIQADMEQSKLWSAEVERDRQMAMSLQWAEIKGLTNTGGTSGTSGTRMLEEAPAQDQGVIRNTSSRLEWDKQRAEMRKGRRVPLRFSEMEIEEVE